MGDPGVNDVRQFQKPPPAAVVSWLMLYTAGSTGVRNELGELLGWFPPPGAQPSNILPVKDARITPHNGDYTHDRQILFPVRPTAAGTFWWQGYRVHYTYRGTRYVVAQPSWVTVCVDQVGNDANGICRAKRPEQ